MPLPWRPRWSSTSRGCAICEMRTGTPWSCAAAGFSATTITRLLEVWQGEYKAWHKRSLAGKRYVYVWADGTDFNIRLEEDRLACLVIVGVLPDGRKEVIALEDGYWKPTESWAAATGWARAAWAA